MALATLTCPHCGFFKDLDENLLPPAGTTVTCPKCRGQFPLQVGDPPAAPQPPQPPQTSDSVMPPSPEPYPHPSSTQAAASERRRTLTFSFTGNAREYFGIWIVNTLLRVVTFGIYSPWAKVRKRRYFYGNTLLDDASFDYLADPLAILKGWFIAGGFFGLYSLASQTSPIASMVMMLAFFGLYPWVIVRSRIFNLRNSSHRNIRFSFRADYREAYQVYLWWSLLVPLTLGILAPYVAYRQKRFLVENSAYGTTLFRFDANPKQFYRAFLPMFLLVPLMLAATGGIFLLPKGEWNHLLGFAPLVMMLAIYLVAGLYLPTVLTNLTWSATSIGGHRFQSTLRVRDLAWIHLSSAVAVLCTLGLLAPWAAVRLARYRLDKLTLSGIGRLDSIIAAENEAMGATGEELGDMLGFDLGL
ncbi:MAG: hypothetical protein A2075_17665 [Geobacteraceae bacterium GWC2_58_44]|nr:MAG: hypothetical protein A2075_17665 [Geobacteraceae bacterium GWC2_58_44]HBG04337.1 hypothetical protein [Geobacter sp.]